MKNFEIRPFKNENIKKVKEFNGRLKSKGQSSMFPDNPVPYMYPKENNNELYREYYLCIEDNKTVVGAYILQNQVFFINGKYQNLADFMLPISEGSINKNYNFVGLIIQNNALKKQPNLFALGMGGEKNKIYQIHKANKWRFFNIPFLFRIINFSSFIKNIKYFQNRKKLYFLLKILKKTLIIDLIVIIYNFFIDLKINKKFGEYSEIQKFSDWSNDIWNKSKTQYDLIAKRDCNNLNVLYANNKNLIRLKIKKGHQTYGWCILKKSKLKNHNHFGDMQLGTIIDFLSLPKYEKNVVQAALYYFKENKVDLIVTNQANKKFINILQNYGFFKGPSNFDFAVSKSLSGELQNSNANKFHINRGDGDGPINL